MAVEIFLAHVTTREGFVFLDERIRDSSALKTLDRWLERTEYAPTNLSKTDPDFASALSASNVLRTV
jgi:hypothetical protein